MSAGTTNTTPSLAERAISIDQSTKRRDPIVSNCFIAPNRWPDPAARTMVHIRSPSGRFPTGDIANQGSTVKSL
jgi:hypothetical protein